VEIARTPPEIGFLQAGAMSFYSWRLVYVDESRLDSSGDFVVGFIKYDYAVEMDDYSWMVGYNTPIDYESHTEDPDPIDSMWIGPPTRSYSFVQEWACFEEETGPLAHRNPMYLYQQFMGKNVLPIQRARLRGDWAARHFAVMHLDPPNPQAAVYNSWRSRFERAEVGSVGGSREVPIEAELEDRKPPAKRARQDE
jgi:hypothetical protein